MELNMNIRKKKLLRSKAVEAPAAPAPAPAPQPVVEPVAEAAPIEPQPAPE